MVKIKSGRRLGLSFGKFCLFLNSSGDADADADADVDADSDADAESSDRAGGKIIVSDSTRRSQTAGGGIKSRKKRSTR